MDNQHSNTIPVKENGEVPRANGGELLFLTLPTGCCIYRAAKNRDIIVTSDDVECRGEFEPTPGSTAQNVTFGAKVAAEAY